MNCSISLSGFVGSFLNSLRVLQSVNSAVLESLLFYFPGALGADVPDYCFYLSFLIQTAFSSSAGVPDLSAVLVLAATFVFL